MRCLPYEQHTLETELTQPEIRSRLATCCQQSLLAAPSRGNVFVGRVDGRGFCLVPLIWGQSSFLPQMHGRFYPHGSGTRIVLQVVPNVALLVCLLIVFSFMGILVYDKLWMRVVAVTSANILLAALLLHIGFWVAVDASRRRLLKLLDAAPGNGNRVDAARETARWPVANRLLGVAIFASGASMWWMIHSGRVTMSIRPAIDLVTISWTTLGLMVVWMYQLSGMSPVTRVRCLLAIFAAQIGWSWFVTFDGFAGDGRPLFTWRWLAKDDTVDTTDELRSGGKTPNTAADVDLRPKGTHDVPAFRGLRRDGVIDNVRLDANWEQRPPRIIWQQPIGIGWSSYIVANGHAVTQEQRGADEAVVCYEIVQSLVW